MARTTVSSVAILLLVSTAVAAPRGTGEDAAARHKECLGFFSAKDDANFIKCFADSAIVDFVDSGQTKVQGAKEAVEKRARPLWDGFPDVKLESQLIVVNGTNLASIDILSGTNSGPFMGGPTNKNVGLYMGHVLSLDSAKPVAKKVSAYMDYGTLLGQLGLSPAPHRPALSVGWPEKVVAVSRGNATEKANAATWKKGLAAWNKHDAARALADYAADAVLHDLGAPVDTTGKAEIAKAMQGYWKAFSDLKVSYSSVWAAADWVVATGTAAGTNNSAAPELGIAQKTGKKVKVNTLELVRFDGGKVKDQWIFYNGVAMAQQLGLVPPPGAPAPGAGKSK
ncbi:MAG TPA: ester cyclase [Polyangia bacterium]|nr:ester cyclase [Polyangia bacterium]